MVKKIKIDMRKINDFGQFLIESTDMDLNAAADEIHPIDYSIVTISDEEELTPEKLEEILDNVLSVDDSDERVRLISKLRAEHPQIRENEPYKTIYWNAVRKWHESTK